MYPSLLKPPQRDYPSWESESVSGSVSWESGEDSLPNSFRCSAESAYCGLGTEVSFSPGRVCSQLLEASRVPCHTVCFCVCSVTQLCPTLCNPMDCTQAPLSMEFSRPGYWSGLPFPSPGDHPNSGIKPASTVFQVDSLPLSYQESPQVILG